MDEETHRVDAAEKAGANHRHEHRLCPGPQPCPVAAPDLAIDHRRSDGLFATVVRGGHARMTQVREHLTRMILEEVGQPPVAIVRETPSNDSFQPGGEPARTSLRICP